MEPEFKYLKTENYIQVTFYSRVGHKVNLFKA